MVDAALTDAFTIPMETPNVSGSYNAKGEWSITQAPVFYGSAADIASFEGSSSENNNNGDKNGEAATTGRISVGTISFGDHYVPTADRIKFVEDIEVGLPRFVATPRFSYIDSQDKLEALVIKFSADDTPNTPLQLAQGAWDGAFNGLQADLRALGVNNGAVVDEERGLQRKKR